MVFSTDEVSLEKKGNNGLGQVPRDLIRIQALQKNGHEVYTFDETHSPEESFQYDNTPSHCRGDWNVSRTFIPNIRKVWGENIQFNAICLDYFSSPNSWVSERLINAFFAQILPSLAGLLTIGRIIWLPHIQHVREMVNSNRDVLSRYYDITEISNPLLCPLYKATEDATSELLKLGNHTNSSQRVYLNHETPL